MSQPGVTNSQSLSFNRREDRYFDIQVLISLLVLTKESEGKVDDTRPPGEDAAGEHEPRDGV